MSLRMMKQNKFKNLVFFLVLWLIVHLTLILTGCFEGYSEYNFFYDEFREPQYDEPKMFGESLFYIALIFLPYWIIKILTSLIISIKNKSFMWPNHLMFKLIPITTAIIFFIVYLPLLESSAQKTKENKRIRSIQFQQSLEKRYDDGIKKLKEENVERILEENKFKLQE